MFEEKNTAQQHAGAGRDLRRGRATPTSSCSSPRAAARPTRAFLFQATPSILTRDRLLAFLKEKVLTLGTAACPPYHLAIVIGGTSAELTHEDGEARLRTISRRAARLTAREDGHAFRDLEMEQEILKMTQSLGVGAQFGGKYFCHDVRVIRLPRHGASLPIGLGVSCSADRQALGKITRDGVYPRGARAQSGAISARRSTRRSSAARW